MKIQEGINHMETVYCLYRVSTKKQVNKEGNDIPMQKNRLQRICSKYELGYQ